MWAIILLGSLAMATQNNSTPGTLQTRWAKLVSATKPHPEYPRPQMVRENWVNLNGSWDYTIESGAGRQVDAGTLLVPFPIESSLSSVKRFLRPAETLVYSRTFSVSPSMRKGRLLLHFGAVDFHAVVLVNGKRVVEHKGGYTPFSADITEALDKSAMQRLEVRVKDPTDSSTQPRGKQVLKPEGIWYTPTSGIWQTVWIEPVPQSYIKSFKAVPDIDKGELVLSVDCAGTFTAIAKRGNRTIAKASGKRSVTLKIPNAKLWSPEKPELYDLLIVSGEDKVKSYFGMRKVSLGKDSQGRTTICLNNKPYFMLGTLDQGFWPDGIYTSPTDDAMRYDLEQLKALGFNTLRKHVKVECARYYFWCDKLGLIVWQDMPSGDKYIGGSDPDVDRTPESASQYKSELKEVIDTFGNAPSILIWVPFNEGWGQFNTASISRWIKQLDPSRLVNPTSGWTDRKVGDMIDWHSYPGPVSPMPEKNRAAVLGEFGGLGLPIQGHVWQEKANWGYVGMRDKEELTSRYENLLENVKLLRASQGLSAAIYTQTTDVEIEVNGLMTYDRAILKLDKARARAANISACGKLPTIEVLIPTAAERAKNEWRYTVNKPQSNWFASDFDDSRWKRGIGGFGTEGTPGARVGTRWDTNDIWLRRTIELKQALPADTKVWVHHDEDVELFLDGTLIFEAAGYTTGYVAKNLKAGAYKMLTKGKHTLAVHCKQTSGGQFIDMGFVRVKE